MFSNNFDSNIQYLREIEQNLKKKFRSFNQNLKIFINAF